MKCDFRFFLLLFLFVAHESQAQPDWKKAFADCDLPGSVTLYDYRNKHWFFSDSVDAERPTEPASTFKIANLLIALETGVIADVTDTVRWPGHTDTTLYGYRPDIYKDLSVGKAFEVSAGWVFVELAKKIGKENYRHYLRLCGYGNRDPGSKDDFWNFGPLRISPRNQVEFLVRMYEGKLPFSMHNLSILKETMITERTETYTIRSKTGWTRIDGKNIGWWVGYVAREDNLYFFATRLVNNRSEMQPGFGPCRIQITKNVLNQLHLLD